MVATLLSSDGCLAHSSAITVGQGKQPLALPGVLAHRVAVGPRGEGRISVTELPHHRDGVLAEREEE
jgi:hypothetical protein